MFSTTVLWIVIAVLLVLVLAIGWSCFHERLKKAEYESRLTSLYKGHEQFTREYLKLMGYFAASERMRSDEAQRALKRMIKAHCRVLMTQPVRNRGFQTLNLLMNYLVDREQFEEQEALLLEAARTRQTSEEDW